MKKLLSVLLLLCLLILLAACEDASVDSTSDGTFEGSEQHTENSTQSTNDSILSTDNVLPSTQKLTFEIEINPESAIVDGKSTMVGEKKLTFEYDPNDTWITFAEQNKDAGFSIDKDFYGEKNLVYYNDNGTRYEVFLRTGGFMYVGPDDEIGDYNYFGLVPHRETIQGEWFYEVSNEPFVVEGYLQPFNKQGKSIILDISAMTYTIKQIKLQKMSDQTFLKVEEIIATGKYTSSDGDTLGATLTFDNGYVLKTNRSKYDKATLVINNENIVAQTADRCSFYTFG